MTKVIRSMSTSGRPWRNALAASYSRYQAIAGGIIGRARVVQKAGTFEIDKLTVAVSPVQRPWTPANQRPRAPREGTGSQHSEVFARRDRGGRKLRLPESQGGAKRSSSHSCGRLLIRMTPTTSRSISYSKNKKD